MALDIVNPIQNTSYVNKDFESVYSELLDLVKQLTYKWDPSISNESDPGVILLKLNAIIADKLSYNMDKNILECFPLSVTQEGNARQLFEQLGYYMKWYRGATTDVSIKWTQEDTGSSYTIPAFTMVSDYDSNIVYTLIGPAISGNIYAVGDQILNTDGNIITFKAVQGIPVQYDINGETLIRYSALDSNKRLYFNSSDIAENGIFIRNRGTSNYSEWVRVNNLTVQAVSDSDKYFRFGVTTDGTTCYIEFPDNAETLFGEGVEITYIRTLGSMGNVAPRIIEKFYQDLVPAENSGIILNSDNTIIINNSSAANGSDPEGINQAYRGYKRTVGTFDTLVTLRDYFNYLVNAEGLVSNAVVADRTNDIQCTYKVVSQKTMLDNTVTYVEKDANDDPELTAYSLKLYMLRYVPTISSREDYEKTFTMLNNYYSEEAKNYMEDSKSIQHDYADILGGDSTTPHVCYFINKYPITCNITTQYSLTGQEAKEVVDNVKLAIYKNLNSKEIDFGEEIPIDLIKNIIVNADKRIKDITLGNIEYHTYAVYYTEGSDGNGTFTEVDLAGSDSIASAIRYDVYAKSILSGVTQFYIKDESFDYQLSRLANTSGIIDNIKNISTSVTVQVPVTSEDPTTNPNTSGYTIRSGETIQMFAPNLLDAAEYSNYVRWEYCLLNPGSISANESYRLKQNEWILFYWKDTDANSEIYNYTGYSEGFVINPSFNLPQCSTRGDLVGTTLTNLTPVNVGTTNNPLMMISSSRNGDMSGDLSSTISNSSALRTNALSGSKKIKVRQINLVELDVNNDNYFCYWILNNQENSYYTLFDANDIFTETSSGSGIYTRSKILDTGEYFFYTNSELTQLTILGAGTQIEDISNSSTATIWSVPVLDSSRILNDGASAFSSSDWFRIPSSDSCNLVESQYYNFGEGVTIYLYQSGGSGNVSISKSPAVDLSSYNIYYKTNDTVASLPGIDLRTNEGWSAKALLSLSLSPEEDQYLLSGQSITYTLSDNTTTTVSGSNLNTSGNLHYYPVAFLASRNVSISGSDDSNQALETVDGIEYLKLYKFKKYVESADNTVLYEDTGRIALHFDSTHLTKSIPVQLPKGNYILPFFIPQSVGTKTFTANLGSTALTEMNSSVTNITGSGVHYLAITISSDSSSQANLTFTVNNTTEEFNLQVLNVYRYGYLDGIEQSEITAINTMIANLDVDNLFNYTYEVDEDIQITDPTASEAFLSPYHPYNKFTICEFDTSNSAFKVLNKR